uniref:Putative glycosyltransferase n=2 Tax=viral metagenome TaxID=1070528 RepID=A0A6H1ZAW5_9ZZZZ
MLTCSIAVYKPDMEMFRKMLRSLKMNTPELGQLLIFINSDNDTEIISEVTHIFPDDNPIIQFQSLGRNVGFGEAHNKNLEEAIGKYFAVLNDDIEFFEKWATPMIKALHDKQVGQVCMREGQCNTLNWKADGLYSGTDSPEYAEGSCFMMRTKVAKQMGLFDILNYPMAYLEDTDLSLRVRKAGYSIKSVPVKWIHHRAVTSSKLPMMRGYEARNKIQFRKRWTPYLLTKDIHKDKTVVVKRTGSIGDVFFTLPILDALKKKYPTAAIILKTSTPQAIKYDRRIDAIVDVGYPIPTDIFIDLDDSYEQIPWVNWLKRYAEVAKIKSPLNKKALFLTMRDTDIQAIDTLIPVNFGRFVLLDLSDTWESKQWSMDNYKRLAMRLKAEGYQIVVTGVTNQDVTVIYDLSFVNILDVLQTGALMRRTSLFIGHEGLLSHISLSMRVPSIILYGCTSPDICNDIKSPYLYPVVSPIPCQGCRHTQQGYGVDCPIHFECMQMITIDVVFEKCREALKEEILK